jgi:hypothetical protein
MQDFKRATINLGTFEEFKEKNKEMFVGFSDTEIKFQYERLNQDIIFMNNDYQVNVDINSHRENPSGIPVIHLLIKRIDNKEICSWRDLQDIKNMLLGKDIDAVELFPMESRNIKEIENQRHLWCMPIGNVFPVGWFEDKNAPKPFLKIVK